MDRRLRSGTPMGSRPLEPESVTGLLLAWHGGDLDARDRLFAFVYDELRRRAAQHLRREKPGHTLRPTALVHEAYLRVLGQERIAWQDRAHFFAVASETMRRILVDHARKRNAFKRAGSAVRVALEEHEARSEPREVDLIALDDAMRELATLDARQSSIVELRFFGGLTLDEIAEVLSVSRATIKREWDFARVWLYRRVAEVGA
jgi:RNA polymerase sigma factor (TIGR02999 family)